MIVLIVGAPRSGTKMLRELLKLHPLVSGGVHEEERIWSYRNQERTSRSLSEDDLTPEIASFIRSHFERRLRGGSGMIFVDKNVSNCLRIGFVRKIFPEAPIIHILRDGRDSVCSARLRWQKPLDTGYILKNRVLRNKELPILELPYFVGRELRWAFQRTMGGREHVKWWGPRFDDMEALSRTYALIELCGIQWARCVEAAVDGLAKLDASSYISVKYEDLVQSPSESMERICTFLSLPFDEGLGVRCEEYGNMGSVGRWRKDLTTEELEQLYPHIGRTLERAGYTA